MSLCSGSWHWVLRCLPQTTRSIYVKSLFPMGTWLQSVIISNYEWLFEINLTSNDCVQGSIEQKSINYSFSFQDPLRHEIANLADSRETNTSPENCVGIYGDKYCPDASPTLHWILQMAPTEAENTMRMSAMVTSVKRITLREKGRDWLSSPPSIGSKLGSL